MDFLCLRVFGFLIGCLAFWGFLYENGLIGKKLQTYQWKKNEARSDRDGEGSLREEDCMNGSFCKQDWQEEMCLVGLSSLSLPFPLPFVVSSDFPSMSLITHSTWKDAGKQAGSCLLFPWQLSLALSFSGLPVRTLLLSKQEPGCGRLQNCHGRFWGGGKCREGVNLFRISGPRSYLFYSSNSSKAVLPFPLWAAFASDLTYFEVFNFSDKAGTVLSLDNITVNIRDKLPCWYKQVQLSWLDRSCTRICHRWMSSVSTHITVG